MGGGGGEGWWFLSLNLWVVWGRQDCGVGCGFYL